MFEININSNSPRISLARAAQLTGYHQDYLGQLCRLGKLPATKVGRNWFTSAEALNNLSANLAQEEIFEESSYEAMDQVDDVIEQSQQITVAQPYISQNITVSEVDGMPIAIETLAPTSRNTNNVQTLLQNLRIESLQNEVSELRQLLFKLMQEVKAHAGILESQQIFNRVQDSLKHSYVSNFDFSVPMNHSVNTSQANSQIQRIEKLEAALEPRAPIPTLVVPDLTRRYEVVGWLAAGAAILVITFIGFGAISGSFFGTEYQTKIVYYKIENKPNVAGAETSVDTEILPTDTAGSSIPNVIQ